MAAEKILSVINAIYNFLKPIYLGYGIYIKYGTIFMLCAICFAILFNYGLEAGREKYRTTLEKIRNRSNKYLHAAKTEGMNYDVIVEKLSRCGAWYYSKGKITPLTYVAYKIACAAAGLVLGFLFSNIFTGIIIGMVMFFAPDVFFKIRNSSDNENMQEDIMNMSDIIILQAGAGTYITQILIDAYLSVQNPRLKDALLELTGNIKSSGNIKESLETFQQRFENTDISDIATALAQSAETGSSVQMLKDIKEHSVIMQKNYALAVEKKVKARVFILSMFMFAGIMGILLFGLSDSLSDSIQLLSM